MRERGKPRASDEENRIIRVDRSFKKKDGRFPPPSDRRPTTRRRRSWEINARSATSVVSSRSTRRADDRSIDPSIDRSIVGLGSRSPVLHHPSRRSVPTKRTRARTHHVFRGTERPIRANDNVALRLRRRAKQNDQSVTPSVHPFIQVVVVVSLVVYPPVVHHHPSTFGNRIERAIALRARTARAPRDLLRPETAA